MYQAPYGHLCGGTGLYEKYLKLGKDVDNLSKRKLLYLRYCDEMFNVIVDQFNGSMDQAMRDSRESELKKALDESVCKKSEEADQIKVLALYYPDKKSTYRPEQVNCMPWRQFRLTYPKLTAPWMLGKAQQLANQWSDSAAPW
jgi:hypothetical protein